MKKLFLTICACCLLAACGSKDHSETSNESKSAGDQETHNYPTYDTTDKTEHINDSLSDGGMRTGGDLRHNVDGNQNGQ